MTFDYASLQTMAHGSDNWPTTWSNDDNQYAMWGDGGGFNGTDTVGRSSLGVAKIVGEPDTGAYYGVNVFGGATLSGPAPGTTTCHPGAAATALINGKSHGAPFSLAGNLYAWITPGSGDAGYQSFTLYKSTNKGCDWAKLGVSFSLASYGISFGSFVQAGKDNAAAIDGYVYTVATKISNPAQPSTLSTVQIPGQVMLLRVPAASIENQSSYEFFKGLDSSGQPTWSSDVHQAVPVYQDKDGVGPFAQMSYVPGLGRFVYTNQHGRGGGDASGFHSLLTMAEAPRPWGPWTDVYRDLFFPQMQPSNQTLFQWQFAPKWFRKGDRTFTLIFSGGSINDSWNTVDGTFSVTP